jgi:hypothetical protein
MDEQLSAARERVLADLLNRVGELEESLASRVNWDKRIGAVEVRLRDLEDRLSQPLLKRGSV